MNNLLLNSIHKSLKERYLTGKNIPYGTVYMWFFNEIRNYATAINDKDGIAKINNQIVKLQYGCNEDDKNSGINKNLDVDFLLESYIKINFNDFTTIGIGDIFNLNILNSNDTQIGHQDNDVWRINDTEILINSQKLLDLPAENNIDINVLDINNNPVGSKVGNDWVIPANVIERRHLWAAPFSYCGVAPNGTAESAPIWAVERIEIQGANTDLKHSTGAWDDVLTLIYT